MRILMLVNSYPSVHSPSGAPYITARVRQLRALGDEVTAVALVPHYTWDTRLPRALARAYANSKLALDGGADGAEFRAAVVSWRSSDVLVGRLGRVPRRGVARAVRAVEEVLAAGGERFDIVHAHGMYTLPAGDVARGTASALGLPYVVSMHGSDVTVVMPQVRDHAAEVLRAAGATMYVSESLRRAALELGAPRQNSHVVPNGTDFDLFHPGTPGEASERRSRWPRLLYVGNLLPVKGADRLPAILARVRDRFPGAVMDVVGSGALAAHLRGRSGITLHGRLPQSQVAQAMREADVLVVPSRSEGWGCVVTESYACGTPVVATAVGGLEEAVLTPDHLVPDHGDDAALADRFARVVQSVLAAPPTATVMRAHVRDADWASIVRQERRILQAVVG